ncbi:MAG: methyltransferase domain-containing protein [Gammaproteobacteria bacterium]
MLNHRSTEKELIDLGPNYYSPEEYMHCLRMLFRVNKIFGFFHGTKKILKNFSETSSLLDIGCGGGLFLLHLAKRFPTMQFMGIDISPDAIKIATQELQEWKKNEVINNVSFKLQPNTTLDFPDKNSDIILATLVCHHLEDGELINFLESMLKISRKAVIINDLHRHAISHWFYKWISPILFRNRLISHDGLISIRRGFTRKEWQSLLQKAGITDYQISWCFPFRWRVILWKK